MGNLVGKDDNQEKQQQQQQQQTTKQQSEKPPKAPVKEPRLSRNESTPSDTKTTMTEAVDEELLDQLDEEEKVPMVFRWEGGGKDVYITGTFNKWSEKIPMRLSGNDFTYIRDLKKGKHAYKFIVDDEWRFAPDQPTVADPHGYINNFIDLSNFSDSFGSDMKPLNAFDAILDDKLYDSICPDPDDPQWYSKEPPPLPPHLRQIILNAPQPTNDTLAAKSMQIPQHVTLNHLYCSAIKENLMVLGVTQRYRAKYVTTVFYSPLPDSNNVGRAASIASSQKTMSD